MVFLYIISMAIAFSFYFGGAQVVFWYKYAIAAMWTMAYFGMSMIKTRKIRGKDYFFIKTYVMPLLLIGGWSIVIWIFNKPYPFSFSNVSRMISNIIYLILAVTSAISCVKIFGKDIIKYTIWAIALSVFANLIYTTAQYGWSLLFQYIPNAIFSTDFPYGSQMYNYAVCLEVQDATLATGFFILYFLLLYKNDSQKKRWLYLIVIFASSYIGFKRTEWVAVAVTILIIWCVNKFQLSEKRITKIVGWMFIIFSFAYIAIVKWDIFQLIIDYYGVNVTGRQNVYKTLASYFELSPLYLGKGFTYVDKMMYDTTGFASHNTIVRMFAEIGFIPFCLWIYWYVVKIPVQISNKFGREVALVSLMSTIYLFMTYCIGNSMNFYCIQYSFVLIPFALAYSDESPLYRKRWKIVFKSR